MNIPPHEMHNKSRWKEALVPITLFFGLLLLLLLPTMKSLRSIEINPENKGFLPESNQLLARNVRLPADRTIDYINVWIMKSNGENAIARSDYESLQIHINSSTEAQPVRTSTNPTLIMREGKHALSFHIQTLRTTADERYTVTLSRTGQEKILLQHPLQDQIKQNEEVIAAIQFAEQKNWITSLIDRVYSENLTGNDIGMYLHRGQQIVAGINPYSCVLEEGSCIGYPAHFPGMYLIAGGFVLMGVHDLDSWAAVWRPIAITTWLAIGIVLFTHLYRRGFGVFAVAAFGFWLFNRWSLDVLRIVHTDFLGVFFLLLAVIMANRKPKTAALLFGASLAIKQLALLALPFFIIMLWKKKPQTLSTLVTYTLLTLLIPFITLLPFLITDAPATIQGLQNPVERPAQAVHGFASSFAQAVDVTNTTKVLLMIYLVGIIYVAAVRKTLSLSGGMLMIFAIIISFTHVLYNQYVIWVLPFIPLTMVEFFHGRTKN